MCPSALQADGDAGPLDNLGSDEAIRHWEEVAALKRLGYPEDIVGPMCFFASDQSAFVTGQALNVCGGIYFH
ncbi:hypothetical protein MESS2_50077 [Mesorhizobium metallidurans STM 2683]|uniref:3-oxoacyl-[acyl-carrier-protein] reductase n=1 Tax=Mesorhizobium metallidurans STM 2683 TaxID=1297569 RepID=M5F5Q7_9HYPH|nr:SDR family oxidoreductase [Mesorhizobium metallidurans]CCV07226.1 hypothetical protein MESS2_50077 [Mesorhizobium metallidurans STM 2683]